MIANNLANQGSKYQVRDCKTQKTPTTKDFDQKLTGMRNAIACCIDNKMIKLERFKNQEKEKNRKFGKNTKHENLLYTIINIGNIT